MDNEKFDIGMIGLGVMGRNFALNMADHKFAVVGFDKNKNKVEALRREGTGKKVKGAKTLEDFLEALESPKIVMMLVPAGKPVDSVIKDVLPYMKNGDIIIDGGNSHFTDTEKRFKKLVKNGIYFLGVGISGGEEGARKGPSMMPGGSEEAYEKVKPIFESAAAKVDNKPCVVYLGPRSAGHYVKM
ncbi:MAG TPA: NADP-dependent phosphogluconate dehydrogenase, partial [Ignavibacteria bacterium]|nr:NADP-dependent phosphogluconate dehydrogenase [Ignavibacteria bacterium]